METTRNKGPDITNKLLESIAVKISINALQFTSSMKRIVRADPFHTTKQKLKKLRNKLISIHCGEKGH